MLYYHYRSKLGLYVGVVRDMLAAVGGRSRTIADGHGTAEWKLDAWIAAFVEEAAARPWMPPIMLREIASGAPHIDHDTFAMMNAVFGAFRDVLVQGQREGAFRRTDPLLTYLTVLPPILIFFARQQVVTRRQRVSDLAVGAPLSVEAFVSHVQASARAMLRRDT
jgi:AcrR family transcriptional regulator